MEVSQDYSDLQKREYEHKLKTVQRIIEIARLIDKSVPQDNFATVFNAAIQVLFFQYTGAPFNPTANVSGNSECKE